MSIQVPINHHFTPVFYLKEWTANDGRLVRYNRPRDVVVAKSCSPSTTGSEDHLYSYEGVPPEKRALLEIEFFSPIDSHASIAHRILLDGGLNKLTGPQRIDWARFLLSMLLRVPQGLRDLERLADQTMRTNLQIEDAEFEALRKPGDPDTMYEWLAQKQPHVLANAHKSFLPGLIDNDELGSYLINMHWATIGVADAKHTLLTGDRPFVSTHGWKHSDATLLFPLSPRMLWVATNGTLQTAQVLKHSHNHMVRTMNEQVARYSVDFVIGTDASQLQFVERRLRKRDEEPVPGVVGKGRPGCPG